MENKKYNAIDAFKFISAVLIIVLHVNPFKGISEPLALVFRNIVTIIAVPFFFTTSGFLFFTKLNISENKPYMVKRYVFRILKMYLIWSLVYFPFVVINWVNEGIDILGYIRDFFFEGSYSTIWFLNATIIACLFVYFLTKKLKYNFVFFICLGFYLVGCALSYYYYIIVKVPFISKIGTIYYSFFRTTKNGLLFGAVFFSLGLLLTNNNKKFKIKWNILFLVLSFIALCIESVVVPKLGYLNKGVDLKISLVPFSYFLVMLLSRIELPNHKIYLWFRGMSINMFLSQRLILSIFPLILSSKSIVMSSNLIYFILIFVCTLLFSWAMMIVGNKIKKYKKLRQNEGKINV